MRSLLVLFAFVVALRPASAQVGLAVGDRLRENVAGFSWYSPAAASLGSIGHRRLLLTGLKFERVVAARGPIAFSWVPELVPLAIVQRTVGDIEKCRRNPNWVTFTCEYDTSAHVAFGAGVSPLGMKLYFNRGSAVRLYGAGNGGVLVFSSDVPVDGSRRANFTFELGGGLEIVRASGSGVSVGYKFHHISNAGTRRLNPGLDANVLYVGFVSRKRPPLLTSGDESR